jgi:L-asparagine transporter-like permease
MSETPEVVHELHEELHRGLEERHIQLMAIGGAIGVGLFLGSATAIKAAGPSIILSYMIGGFILFIIMRALGEMAVEKPISGSFSAYAYEFISPLAGFLTGWTYWFMWVIVGMAETTAIGVYIQFWWPSVPQWTSALICLILLTIVNLIAVKAFGEFEFWFALIKVVTIIVMIIVGLVMIVTGLGNNGVPTGISNIWSHGGFFPNGINGTVSALVMVLFAFLGMELIGVTAGEAKNPDKVIPSAINKVLWRVLIFYVGSLFVIMSIYPWNEIGTKGSPFVLTFSKLGISAAAGIINFVVITAAASACNSGIFTAGRMVYNLSLQGKAPKYFSVLNKGAVPVRAVLVSVAFMLIGVVLNYTMPGKVFGYITSVVTFAGIFVWIIIIVCHMKFRKKLTPEQVKKLKFPALGFPILNWVVIAFLAFVVVVMALNPDDRIAIIVGPIWLIIITAAYYLAGYNKLDSSK